MEKTYGGVIINDNKVLLIRQLSDFYEFPRSIKNETETEIETIVNEVKKDSGLNIKLNEEKRYEINLDIPKTIVFYLGEVIGSNNPQNDKECLTGAEWIDIEDVESSLTFNSSKDAWQIFRNIANI